MSISKLLFGEIALKKKLVTKEQVEECLEIQRKLKEMGITKTLGAVMHDKKFLSMVEIKEILREMTGTKEWNAIEGYEILGKLGKGGMGSVYKARHQKLDKLVALKVLPPELASDQEYLDRFLREARAAAKLNHPNIVQALDVGESYGYHYFVMEYVEGRTVKDMIEQDGPIPEGRSIDLVAQVSEALVHAWKHEMVHRDIKPSNIIVNDQGVAKLCDLGLAKSVTEDQTITQTGVIMGTPFYLSPEQARSEDLDCRSDLYSLGVTLFHMLTGQVPFTGNSAATILYKHIFLDPPKARSLNPKITDGISKLVQRMMAKSRDDRPQNPSALLEDLAALGEAIGEPPVREREREPVTRSSARLERKTENVETAPLERLDNSLVDSKPVDAEESSERTGSFQGAISGPSAVVRSPDSTVGSDEITEPIRGSHEAETLDLERPAELARAKPRARPAVAGNARRLGLLVGGSVGLVALTGFVAWRCLAPAPPPTDATTAAIAEAAISGCATSATVEETVARVMQLRRERKVAGAAEVIAGAMAPRPDAEGRMRPAPLSAADRAALAAARDQLVSDTIHEFAPLDKRYGELAKASGGGTDLDQVLRAVQALDLPALARLAEGERAGLAAERAELVDSGDRPRAPER
jgi:serine/threonine-protein kinase